MQNNTFEFEERNESHFIEDEKTKLNTQALPPMPTHDFWGLDRFLWKVTPQNIEIDLTQTQISPIQVQVAAPKHITSFWVEMFPNAFVEMTDNHSVKNSIRFLGNKGSFFVQKKTDAPTKGAESVTLHFIKDADSGIAHQKKIHLVEEPIEISVSQLSLIYNKLNQQFVGATQFSISNDRISQPLHINVLKQQSDDRYTAFPIQATFNVNTQKLEFLPLEGLEDVLADEQENLSLQVRISTPEKQHLANITLNLEQVSVNDDFIQVNLSTDFNFCLDKNAFIRLRKRSAASDRFAVSLYMEFQTYNNPIQTHTEVYNYYAFEPETTIYPGEEIHDFFPNMKHALPNINLEDITSIPLIAFCRTTIHIEEKDALGNTHYNYPIGRYFFIAGSRPKAFPYLTQTTVRTVYQDTQICLCTTGKELFEKQLFKWSTTTENNNYSSLERWVMLLCANRKYIEKKPLITTQDIQLISRKNPLSESVTVLFQNQNKCIDFMAFSGEFWKYSEFDFLTETSSGDAHRKKFDIKKSQKIELQTGWLFDEEIPLLEELIESEICFILIEKQWVKAFAINKKTLKYNPYDKLYEYIVEFEKI